MQDVLTVVEEFESAGGASLGLVAWELFVGQQDVLSAWEDAKAQELIVVVGHDPLHDEPLWRLTRRGRRHHGRQSP